MLPYNAQHCSLQADALDGVLSKQPTSFSRSVVAAYATAPLPRHHLLDRRGYRGAVVLKYKSKWTSNQQTQNRSSIELAGTAASCQRQYSNKIPSDSYRVCARAGTAWARSLRSSTPPTRLPASQSEAVQSTSSEAGDVTHCLTGEGELLGLKVQSWLQWEPAGPAFSEVNLADHRANVRSAQSAQCPKGKQPNKLQVSGPKMSKAAKRRAEKARLAAEAAHGSGARGGAPRLPPLQWVTQCLATATAPPDNAHAGVEVWHSDQSGVEEELALDDREAALVTTWVRTGQWRAPAVALLLALEAVEGKPMWRRIALRGGRLRGLLLLQDPGPAAHPAELHLQVSGGNTEVWKFSSWQALGTPGSQGVHFAAYAEQHLGPGGVNTYRLRHRATREAATWQRQAEAILCRSFLAWKQSRSDESAVMTAGPSSAPATSMPDEGQQAYWFNLPEGGDEGGAAEASGEEGGEEEGWWRPACGGAVRVARGEGGHVLVWGEVGPGEHHPQQASRTVAGWFVVDPAVGGMSITAAAADQAGLDTLGEVHFEGINGAVSSAFRRGERGDFRLGPLVLRAPLFCQVALDGAIRGPPGEVQGAVVGVCGAEALRRCVLELRAPLRKPGALQAPRLRALVHDPARYEAPAQVAMGWQPLTFVGGAAHTQARVRVTDGDIGSVDGYPAAGSRAGPSGLFLMSLGVGGVGAVLKREAALRWRVLDEEGCFPLGVGGVVSGAGADMGQLAAVEDMVTVRMPAVHLAGASFDLVRTLVHVKEDPKDLDLAVHADGALCSDLWRGCTLVLDAPHSRMAVFSMDRTES